MMQRPTGPAPPVSASASTWKEHKTDEGRTYYYNTVTKQTQWDKPPEMKSHAELLLSTCPWKEFKTPEGKPYFHNSTTKETVWKVPDELQRIREQLEADQQQREAPAATTAASLALEGGPEPGQVPATKQFASHEEAHEAFIGMLDTHDVAHLPKWEDVHRVVMNDPLFSALHTMAERKGAFADFRARKAREARAIEAKKARELCEQLKEHLLNYKYIWPDMRFGECADLMSDEAVWRAVANERDRRDVFDDVVRQLKRQHHERDLELRRERWVLIRRVILSFEQFDAHTPWATARPLILAHADLQPVAARGKKLVEVEAEEEGGAPSMREVDEDEDEAVTRQRTVMKDFHELDVLVVWEEVSLERGREEETVIRKARDVERTRQRTNREAFLSLLETLEADRRIHASSTWKETYPLIRDDARVDAMLGQPGSSPLDLFKLRVQEMRDRVTRGARDIRTLVHHCAPDFVFSARTTLAQLEELLAAIPSVSADGTAVAPAEAAAVSSSSSSSTSVAALPTHIASLVDLVHLPVFLRDLPMVFEYLHAKAERREEQVRTALSRDSERVKRLFRRTLARAATSVPIDPNAVPSWAEYRLNLSADVNLVLAAIGEEECASLFANFLKNIPEPGELGSDDDNDANGDADPASKVMMGAEATAIVSTGGGGKKKEESGEVAAAKPVSSLNIFEEFGSDDEDHDGRDYGSDDGGGGRRRSSSSYGGATSSRHSHSYREHSHREHSHHHHQSERHRQGRSHHRRSSRSPPPASYKRSRHDSRDPDDDVARSKRQRPE